MGREIEFIGNHRNHSVLIGNHGDVKLRIIGTFELSGMIYCSKSTVEVDIQGAGTVTFRGTCRKLVIRNVNAEGTLDFTQLTTREVWCELVKGKSNILLGPTNLIRRGDLGDEATLSFVNRPLIIHYSSNRNKTKAVSRRTVESKLFGQSGVIGLAIE